MPDERDTIRDLVSAAAANEAECAEETIRVDLAPLARQMLLADENGKKPCLLVLDGLGVGDMIPLDEGPITIGRSNECDIIIRDDGISRWHARVELLKQDRLSVEDLSSTNGTFIGGKRVDRGNLKVGEKVLFGRRTLLRFVLEDNLDRLYQQEIYASSTRDGLTGIHNRKYIVHRIAAELSFTKRHNAPCTFLIFDIDQFKDVNRLYGHQTGDQVLVTVTQVIGDMIRAEDVFGRYGGEEFAIIAQGIDFNGGKMFANRLCERIAAEEFRALDKSGDTLKVSASVGVVSVREGTVTNADKVIAVAVANLNKAKKRAEDKVIASEIC